MSNTQTTLSPFDQKPVSTRQTLSSQELSSVIDSAVKAQKQWKLTSIAERQEIATRWMAELEKQAEPIAKELSEQMGRPISQGAGELRGTLQRARYLIKVAPESLKESAALPTETPNVQLTIRRDPIGVVGIISPWNYPYLVTVNTLLAGLLAGNAVILKPSPQTPSVAERFQSTFEAAGLPKGVLQTVHLDIPRTAELAADGRIGYLSFTGSVAVGKKIDQTAANGTGFKAVGLELGGKDPAYVRADADVKWTAEQLVDGALFNSGQSCCAIERIYVHEKVYDEFVQEFARLAAGYKLGDPLDPNTNLGPVVSLASAERIRKQVEDALSKGAKNLVPAESFPAAKAGTTLIAPTVLVNVNHTMEVMTEETFGPVIGIQKVSGDDEALQLMNDSHYGLTASVWTDAQSAASLEAFERFASEIEAGTVYLNRSDVLEPALPWTGVKDSGRGISLSTLGFDQVTRAKGIHKRFDKP